MIGAADTLKLEWFLSHPEMWDRIEVYDGLARATVGVGARHGEITVNVASAVWDHATPRGAGRVYGPSTRCVLQVEPLRVLAPDVCFVRTDRLPPDGQRDLPLLIPPDLAVEIVSPWSPEIDVVVKQRYYLDAGTPLVVIIDSQQRLVTAHAPGRSPRTFSEGDVLDGGDVLPDFRLPVAEIFW